MATTNLFQDIQDCLDAMAQAVERCADEESSIGEMWNEIDASCQRLSSLSAGDVDDDDEEDDELTDAAEDDELNFDQDDDGDAFEDDDEVIN